MPVFETPGPIAATIEVLVGDVRVAAGDRTDTVVEVQPTDPASKDDVKAAAETLVEDAGGRLAVRRTRRWRGLSSFGHGGSVNVLVELPTGSRVAGESATGDFRCTGPLGDLRLKTALGNIEVDDAAAVVLSSAAGDVSLGRASGDARLTTSSGALRAGEVGGAAVIKNSNGDSRVDEVAGDVRIKSANGDIAVGRAHASVMAATANGSIRIAVAERGSVVAETGFGGVEIGIAEGTTAWLDLTTGHGRLHNELEDGGPPAPGEEAVEVRARSGFGDITIRRAPAEQLVEHERPTSR
jgi:Putative adhesin